MLELSHTYLDHQERGIAKIYCARCHQELGRVQVKPPTAEDDPVAWEEKVQGEIDVLESEHRDICPAR